MSLSSSSESKDSLPFWLFPQKTAIAVPIVYILQNTKLFGYKQNGENWNRFEILYKHKFEDIFNEENENITNTTTNTTNGMRNGI